MKRDAILKQHPYRIIQSPSDHRWRTYVMLDGQRKLIAKSTRNALEEDLMKYYDKPKKLTLKTLYQEWHS